MFKKNFKFSTCPNCRGKGCVRCNNIGVFLQGGFQIFYWGPTSPQRYLAHRKINLILNDFIDALALIFGIAILIYQLAVLVWEGGKVSGVLGFALLSLCFVFFRLSRRREYQQKLDPSLLSGEKREYLGTSPFLKEGEGLDVEPFLDRPALIVFLKAKGLNPASLLRTLLQFPDIKKIILRLGLPFQELREKYAKMVSPNRRREFIFEAGFKKTILAALVSALSLGRKTIGRPELFLGLLQAEPKLLAFFEDRNLNWSALYHTAEWIYYAESLRARWKRFLARARLKPGGVMNRAYTSRATPVLDRVSEDLTLQAKHGALPFLINREKELQEILVNLSQADGNVILVGKPGVGKSALAYGLANLMAEESVPSVLEDKRLVSFDLAALVKSANPAVLLQKVISEVIASGNIILFIDNISNLIGLGQVSAGLDAAEILMPVLPKPTVNVIGVSSEEDYHTILEQQSDFLSRFQVIKIEEPDQNLCLKILESRVGLIEYQENIFFTYPALEQAITLSQKYIYDTYLPAKAINLLTDAASKVLVQGKSRIVRGEDIVHLVEEQIKVPLSKISREEGKKLLNLEEEMHKRIVDQEEGVAMVAEALRRARAGMRSEKRPICSLLFVGPTGVGKTETAKTLAEIYFGSEGAMIRLDMSEYQTPEAINKLIGPPSGFSGAERGGYLTEAVRKKPFSLLLLDELEKAHPDILNAFLQVIEDGRLTDSRGRTIDFTNTIIIATSNAGTPEITQAVKQGIELTKIKPQIIEEVLTQYFRLEFLNRFDGIVLFQPLSPENVFAIAKLMLAEVGKRLAKKNIRFSYTEEMAQELAQKGFDSVFGARPLRRLIQDTVDNALARQIISGELGARDLAILEKGGKITIQQAEEI